MSTEMDFREFPKMGRWSRDVIVTEKIDGTNAQIYIAEDGATMLVGSRSRWIAPENDNFGFARWARENEQELLKLGPGRHFGEWWGAGIGRRYGLAEKRLSLFNVARWHLAGVEPKQIPSSDPRIVKMQEPLPACVGLVPELWRGPMDALDVPALINSLAATGSRAVRGFARPEGIVIFHVAAGVGFKKTLDKDDMPKSLAA